MNPKKIAASAVAVALGTSAIVAPQVTALPEEFVSPPGAVGNPGQDECQVVMEDTVSTSRPGEAREATQSGVTAGVALNEANTEYLTWVTLDSKGERIFERAEAEARVANDASKNVTQSFTVKEQQPGELTFDAKLKGGRGRRAQRYGHCPGRQREILAGTARGAESYLEAWPEQFPR